MINTTGCFVFEGLPDVVCLIVSMNVNQYTLCVVVAPSSGYFWIVFQCWNRLAGTCGLCGCVVVRSGLCRYYLS